MEALACSSTMNCSPTALSSPCLSPITSPKDVWLRSQYPNKMMLEAVATPRPRPLYLESPSPLPFQQAGQRRALELLPVAISGSLSAGAPLLRQSAPQKAAASPSRGEQGHPAEPKTYQRQLQQLRLYNAAFEEALNAEAAKIVYCVQADSKAPTDFDLSFQCTTEARFRRL